MIDFLIAWTVGSFFLFAVFELTFPVGRRIKKWPRRVLFVIYLPLYVIGGVFFVVHKGWILLNGGREDE